MRADIEAVLDSWRSLDRGESRRLQAAAAVQHIETAVGAETVSWFQGVEWSVPLFSTEPARRAEPESGVLVVTATRLVLVGTRSTTTWPLGSVERFSFRPASFVRSSPPHFVVRTTLGEQNLVPGGRVAGEPMLRHVREALVLARAEAALLTSASSSEPPDAGGQTDAGAEAARRRIETVIGEFATLRDRGTITQAQFEAERQRLLDDG